MEMNHTLQATERELGKDSFLTQNRNEGNIPAIIYGKDIENKPVYVCEADFVKMIRDVGKNGVFSLDVNGKKINVMLSEYQLDPVKKNIVHLDFLAVDMTQEVQSVVRIDLIGEAAGVKDGGVMQQPLKEVKVTATPLEMPQVIEVDVTNLQVGETIRIGDIKGNRSYEINHEDEETIVSILPPKQEEEIHTGEEQEPGIPENLEGRETNPEEG